VYRTGNAQYVHYVCYIVAAIGSAVAQAQTPPGISLVVVVCARRAALYVYKAKYIPLQWH